MLDLLVASENALLQARTWKVRKKLKKRNKIDYFANLLPG